MDSEADHVKYSEELHDEDFVDHANFEVDSEDHVFEVACVVRSVAYEHLVEVDVVLEINALDHEEEDRAGPEYEENYMGYEVMVTVLDFAMVAP